MRISESRLSGFYFFLAFLAIVIGFSLYKSFYAVVSPKYLQEVLRTRLAQEVELYDLKLEMVDFHFFHGIFFKPGLEWKGFHISYSKNCNYIEVSSPDVYFAVDLTKLFRRRLELEEVIANRLDVKIIKDYACENIESLATAERKPAQFNRPVASSNLAEARDLLLVKNLPDFRVGNLTLYTERNLSRYMQFKNLSITAKRATYDFQSDLSFSPSLNVGNLPSLKLNGRFDEEHNIQLSSRLREARMDLRVEALGEKNFKTTFSVSDFPLQYIANMLKERYPALNDIETFGSQWIHINTYTVSQWDDFFDKNLVMYVEDLRLSGDVVKLKAEPFQLKLRERQLVTNTAIQIESLQLAPLLPLALDASAANIFSNAGQVSGLLKISAKNELEFEGLVRDMTVHVNMHGLKRNFEVLPTKITFETTKEHGFFTTNDLAFKGIAGDLRFSLMSKAEKISAKLSAHRLVAGDMWARLFNASIDFVNMDIDFMYDSLLRWTGVATFSNFKGRQFAIESGVVNFERNSLGEKINIQSNNTELVSGSAMQLWIKDVFSDRLLPEKIRSWKVASSSLLGQEAGLQTVSLGGAKPPFHLELTQQTKDEYIVLKSQPRVQRMRVPRAGGQLF